MSWYPSLEEMKVDQLMKAIQKTAIGQMAQRETYSNQYPPNQAYPQAHFMGSELSEAAITENCCRRLIAVIRQAQIVPSGYSSEIAAPLSGQSLGLQKPQVHHGIRELILCKDEYNNVGIRVKAIDNGIFVCLVVKNSPAALAGFRFGDQILQINSVGIAGYTKEKVHDLFKKSPVNGISVVVRDRPFERTITVHKDSRNQVGFHFKNGKINNLLKDSSAAKNGLLINHQLLEVDGQNVVGLKDGEVMRIIDNCGPTVTIAIIPSCIYDRMVKKIWLSH